MNADENRIARAVGDLCAHFQRHKIIAFARHDHSHSFCLQNRAELSRYIQRKILFTSVTTHLAFVVATVSGVQYNRLDLAYIWNTMRPHERLNGFCYVSAGHQKLPVLLYYRKAQPTSSTIDHRLAATANEFERMICGLRLYFCSGRNDFRRQSVKFRNIIDGQIIVSVYLDDLPFAGRE